MRLRKKSGVRGAEDHIEDHIGRVVMIREIVSRARQRVTSLHCKKVSLCLLCFFAANSHCAYSSQGSSMTEHNSVVNVIDIAAVPEASAVPEDVVKEITSLRELLAYHNYRYYVLDDPQISDDEYDMMMRRLIALET